MNYPYIFSTIEKREHKLLVDTGANKTIIFTIKKSFQKIKNIRKKWIRFKTFLLPAFSKKVNLKFKNISFYTNILIVDWKKYIYYAKNIRKNLTIFGYFRNFGYDGILGLDILKKITLKIDCETDSAKIIEDIKNNKFQRVPLYSISGHLAIKINIDGQEKYAIVDTGISSADIVVNRKYKNSKLISKKNVLAWNRKKVVCVYKLNSKVIFLNRFFTNLKYVSLNLLKKDNPLICYPFLKRFKTIIFHRGKQIYIR